MFEKNKAKDLELHTWGFQLCPLRMTTIVITRQDIF